MTSGNKAARFDAVIGGGGPTGLAMALALDHTMAGDLRVALVVPEGNGSEVRRADPRAWAISAGSQRLLSALGVWDAVAPSAQDVVEIEITDSSLDDGARRALLNYENRTDSGDPAAFIVPNGALLRALQAQIDEVSGKSITVIRHAINGFESAPGHVEIGLNDGSTLRADLLIAADGRRSQLRDMAGIRTIGWDYPQAGIVAAVRHERPHGGKAVQHFLPGGPFAILPLKGDRSCLTWTEEAREAERIMALDDAGFTAEAQKRFGGKLGPIELEGGDGGRATFPLSAHLARSFVAERFALIGDAAHSVHPIAGQGLNLAYRDVAALAECISDGVSAGLSFGDVTILERYERWRRFDSALSAGAFDALNRLFSNDVALLRSAREVGLGLIDKAPGIKELFVAEAAGQTGDVPKLLR